jgi:hypothetical protein
MKNPVFNLEEHKHGDHCHIKLELGKAYAEKGGLKISDEGCPCCAAGIDLDEVATAISEIGKEGTGDGGVASGEHGHNLAGGLADFSSASHWGIFLGISGPLSVVGLTAAYRNIKGTINTRKKLNHVIDGVEKDIAKYRNEGNTSVVERLEAFKNCLKHSKFDTDFNLVVPGVINGAASGIVLSSAIWHSPWALPVIGAYSACQTGRNVYELIRTWNRILPENLAIKPLEIAGTKKVNQITESKRKFYSANALGFLIFTVGAIVLFLSVIGVIPGLGALIAGIVLLTVGALSTGIMNNIWTNKFKPRNGNLGVDRKELNCWRALEEIGKRREIKKILKTYRNKHLPSSIGNKLKKFGYKVLTSLPFCEQKGAELIHNMNVEKCKERNYTPNGTLTRERLEMLEAIAQVVVPNFQFKEGESNAKKVFRALKELKLEGVILEKFVKDYILKTSDEHDTSVKGLDEYKNKLLESGLFKEVVEEHHHQHHDHSERHHSKHEHENDRCDNGHCEHNHNNKDDHKHKHHHDHRKVKIEFDLETLEKNPSAFKEFMNSLEQYLLFEHIEQLRYQQYGLNDYFWELDKCKSQWKREDVAEHKVNMEGIHSNVKTSLKHNHHHGHHHDHKKENHHKHKSVLCVN